MSDIDALKKYMNTAEHGGDHDGNGRAKSVPVQNVVPCKTRRERRKMQRSCEGGIQWWRVQCWAANAVAELVGSYFLGTFAVGASDYAATYGAGALGSFAVGAVFALVIFAGALTFGQFKAGHLNPAVTLTAWILDPKPFGGTALVRYLSMIVMQLVGYLLAALTVRAYVGGPAPLGCTNVNPVLAATGGGQALAFLMEFLGLLFVLHTFVLSGMRRKGGPLTAAAIGGQFGFLIAVFASSTGGSFNLSRTLGVGIVEGCLASDIWVYIVPFVVAPAVTAVLVSYVFAIHCGGMQTRVVVSEVCDSTKPKTMSKQC